MEAFCSPLIHTPPRYLHISEWTPRSAELKCLCSSSSRGRRRRRRRKHGHVWLYPSASDFRSCSGRDHTSHTQPSPCRLNNVIFEQGKWSPQHSHFLWLLQHCDPNNRSDASRGWWMVMINALSKNIKLYMLINVRSIVKASWLYFSVSTPHSGGGNRGQWRRKQED